MSGWRKRKKTIFFDHPEYDDHLTLINYGRELAGQPPIPHGEPLEILAKVRIEPRHEPLGVGYCQRCKDIMLMNDEQQKWCPACRAERKRYYIEKRNEDE